MAAGRAEGRGALGRTAVEDEARRGSVRLRDLDVAPRDTFAPAGTESLHRGFLRGETTGKMDSRPGMRATVCRLPVREHTVDEALALAVDDLLDAGDVDDVDSNGEDHDVDENDETAPDFELRSADGTSWLACLPFEAQGFVAAFGTRVGVVDGERADATAGRLLAALGIDRPLAMARQVHSATVRVIASERDVASSASTECDGLTTARRGTLLGVKTADCVPVLIADTRTRAVAAVHAGWRGTVDRIVERAFATMVAKHGARREDCLAAIGPAISAQAFEVGPEVVERFQSSFGYAKRLLSNLHGEKGHVDLKAACAIQLEMCGLAPDQISVSDACTVGDAELWFSYRREGAVAGRNVAIVGEVPPEG